MVNDEKQEPKSGDLTRIVGAATDVAPLGDLGTKPPHKLTADQDSDPVEWRRITETAEFKNMLRPSGGSSSRRRCSSSSTISRFRCSLDTRRRCCPRKYW